MSFAAASASPAVGAAAVAAAGAGAAKPCSDEITQKELTNVVSAIVSELGDLQKPMAKESRVAADARPCSDEILLELGELQKQMRQLGGRAELSANAEMAILSAQLRQQAAGKKAKTVAVLDECHRLQKTEPFSALHFRFNYNGLGVEICDAKRRSGEPIARMTWLEPPLVSRACYEILHVYDGEIVDQFTKVTETKAALIELLKATSLVKPDKAKE
jgi:hypothetical protein